MAVLAKAALQAADRLTLTVVVPTTIVFWVTLTKRFSSVPTTGEVKLKTSSAPTALLFEPKPRK